jgi:hypothetical protein
MAASMRHEDGMEREEEFQFINLKLPKTLANLFGRETHIMEDLS